MSLIVDLDDSFLLTPTLTLQIMNTANSGQFAGMSTSLRRTRQRTKCADVETSRFAVLHSSKQFLSSRLALSALGPACYTARFGRVLYRWKTRHMDCL
jgi:hypothetical protein